MEDGRSGDKTDWMGLIESRREGRQHNALEWREPGKVVQALKMLAAGESVQRSAATLGVSVCTMSTMKWRYLPSIEAAQKQMAVAAGRNADKYLALSEKRADQLEADPEALKKVNPKDLAVTAAIHADKMVALSGGATAVVEHRRALSLEDAKKMIEDAEAEVLMKRREGSVEVGGEK